MTTWKARTAAALLAACGLALAAGSAAAQGFYEGKIVKMIVPHSASGGFSKYAQLLGPALAKHLKAKEVRIDHKTGAGGVLGINLVWHAPPDGLTFGLSSGPVILLAQLGGGEGVQFDADKFTYLGRVASDSRLIFTGAKSDIKSIEDIKKLGRPMKVPSQGVDDDFYGMAMLADALGFQVQFVTGYEGGADTTLSIIKGDTDGRLTSWTSATPMLKAGDIRPILNVGEARNPEHPDVVNALELVSDPEKKKTLGALINIQDLHRLLFGPPGMDPKAVAEFRAAVMAMLADPELLAQAKKLDLPINAQDGATQQKVVADVFAASAGVPAILKEAVASLK
jgi:tripartite-type tricarboxylate transporter receptor subunit TctC